MRVTLSGVKKGGQQFVTRLLMVTIFSQFSCLGNGFAFVQLPSSSDHQCVPFFTVLLAEFLPHYKNFLPSTLPTATPFLSDVRDALFSSFGKQTAGPAEDSSLVLCLSSAHAAFDNLCKRLTEEEPPAAPQGDASPEMTSSPSPAHSPSRTQFLPTKRDFFLRHNGTPLASFKVNPQVSFSSDPLGLHSISPLTFHSPIWQNGRSALLQKMLVGCGRGSREGDAPLALSPVFHVMPGLNQKTGHFYFRPTAWAGGRP
ncbi:MAG TPA: hypothetical protein P5079_10705 [Elusimicrobiota bacterium]|nr:hypothetical protein [Elusimicrobiota bacterium]